MKKKVLAIIKEAIYVAFLALYSVFTYIMVYDFRYMRINDIGKFSLITFILLIPLIIYVVRLLLKFITKGKYDILGVLAGAIAMLFIFPTAFIGVVMPIDSYTTDIKNYRKFDSGMNYVVEDEFLPLTVPSKSQIMENTEFIYHYNYVRYWKPSYIVYAEWTLTEDELQKELERINEYFENHYKNETVTEMEMGDFTCIIKHNDWLKIYEKGEEVTTNFEYTFFAYNEKTGQVRYIMTYCIESNFERPYYLELEW